MVDDAQIETAILIALQKRGAGKTICPSEVARLLADDWRPLMPRIRHVAQALANRDALRVTQRGSTVDALIARGPIRLGLTGPLRDDGD